MATDKKFIEFILDQLEHAGEITAKSMFGEYSLYSGGKLFAMLADNRLLFKPTGSGRAFIKNVVEASPYPGAKPCFLIENLDDREWLAELVRITVKELPEPKPKKKKVKQ
jgi:TfoX/Sxy family transcriptional regulator of competence genes